MLASLAADSDPFLPVVLALGALFPVAWLLVVALRFKRCPPDRILVLSGRTTPGAPAKCIHGGAVLVWPILQHHDYLSLEPIQVDVRLTDARSSEDDRVSAAGVFTVAIGTTPEAMQNAAARLLGLSAEAIEELALPLVRSALRARIASSSAALLQLDRREAFLSALRAALEPDLAQLGLLLVHVDLTDLVVAGAPRATASGPLHAERH